MRKLLRRGKRARDLPASVPGWCDGELHLDTAFEERRFADMERMGAANNANSCLEEIITISDRYSENPTSFDEVKEQVRGESRHSPVEYDAKINNFFSYFASGPLSTEEIAGAQRMPKENAYKFTETSFMGGKEDGRQRSVAMVGTKIELQPAGNVMPAGNEGRPKRSDKSGPKSLPNRKGKPKECVKEIVEKNQFYSWRKTSVPASGYASDDSDKHKAFGYWNHRTQSHTQIIGGKISRAISLPQVGLFDNDRSAYHPFQGKLSEADDTDSLAESVTSSTFESNNFIPGLDGHSCDFSKQNDKLSTSGLHQIDIAEEDCSCQIGAHKDPLHQRKETSYWKVDQRNWRGLRHTEDEDVATNPALQAHEERNSCDGGGVMVANGGKREKSLEKTREAMGVGRKRQVAPLDEAVSTITGRSNYRVNEPKCIEDIGAGDFKQGVGLGGKYQAGSEDAESSNQTEIQGEGYSGHETECKMFSQPMPTNIGGFRTLVPDGGDLTSRYGIHHNDEILCKELDRSIGPPVDRETKRSTCRCDQGNGKLARDCEIGGQNAAMERCTIKSHRCESIEETSLIKKFEVEHTVQVHKILKGDNGEERQVFSKTTQFKERIIRGKQHEDEWQLIPYVVPGRDEYRDSVPLANGARNGLATGETGTATTSFITSRLLAQPRDSATKINVNEIELNMAKVANYDVEAAIDRTRRDKEHPRPASKMDQISGMLKLMVKKDEAKPASEERTRRRRRSRKAEKRVKFENTEAKKDDEEVSDVQQPGHSCKEKVKPEIVEKPLDSKLIIEGAKEEEEKRKKQQEKLLGELEVEKRKIEEKLKETKLTKRQKYTLMLMVCAIDADMPSQFFEMVGKSATLSFMLNELMEKKSDLLMYNMYQSTEALDQV